MGRDVKENHLHLTTQLLLWLRVFSHSLVLAVQYHRCCGTGPAILFVEHHQARDFHHGSILFRERSVVAFALFVVVYCEFGRGI
jgi:hypothetical protein